jgi:primosomal protein N'
MATPEEVLVACPKCGCWPMPINVDNNMTAYSRTIDYVCSKCGHKERREPSKSNAHPMR